MNLKNYKYEMNQKYPDSRLVEGTLERLVEKSTKPTAVGIKFTRVLGGIALSAAVLCGSVMGGAAIRRLFGEDNFQIEKNTDNQPVITAEKVAEPRFTETADGLSAVPLSNPKYTLKLNTDNGKIALNEDATIEEMLDCGLTVFTESGILGYENFVKALQNQLNGTAFEYAEGYIFRDEANKFGFYSADSNGKLTAHKEYDHTHFLNINDYKGAFLYGDFAGYVTVEDKEMLGYMKSGTDFLSDMGTSIMPSLYSKYLLSDYTEEELKGQTIDFLERADSELLYYFLSDYGFAGAYRINEFLENVIANNRAGVQFTDIRTGNDYFERFYSIEYINGVFTVFTVTDGLKGTLDTQYFDKYETRGTNLIFKNENTEYIIPMSTDYVIGKKKLSNNPYCMRNYEGAINIFEQEYCDEWLRGEISRTMAGRLVINSEYSEDDRYAVLADARMNSEFSGAMLTDNYIGENKLGIKFYLERVDFSGIEPAVKDDGNIYFMLTDEQLESLKSSDFGSSMVYRMKNQSESEMLVEMYYFFVEQENAQ